MTNCSGCEVEAKRWSGVDRHDIRAARTEARPPDEAIDSMGRGDVAPTAVSRGRGQSFAPRASCCPPSCVFDDPIKAALAQ